MDENKQANPQKGNSPHEIVVSLTAAQMEFLQKQAKSERKTPGQILIAAFLRTYNPRAVDSPSDR